MQRCDATQDLARQSLGSCVCDHIFALDYLRQNPSKLVDLSSLLGHATLDLTAFVREPPEKSCQLS